MLPATFITPVTIEVRI